MSIAFVKTTATRVDASAGSINVATGSPTEGNLMIVKVQYPAGTAFTYDSANWTLIGSIQQSTWLTTGLYWKVAGASEPSYPWSGSSRRWLAELTEFSGVDAADPINQFALATGYYYKNGTNPVTSPSVTPDQDNCMIVAYGSVHYNADDLATDATLTEAFDYANDGGGINASMMVAGYELQGSAAPSGTYVHPITGNSVDHPWHTITVALNEDGSGGANDKTITFGGSTQLLNADGSATIATATPLTGVYYTVYTGHITNIDSVVSDFSGTLTIDDGAATITMTDSTYATDDPVSVCLYHSSFTEPKIYHMTVD